MSKQIGNLSYNGKHIRQPCGEDLCALIISTTLIILPTLVTVFLTLLISNDNWLPGIIMVVPYIVSGVNSVRLILKTAMTDPGIIPIVKSAQIDYTKFYKVKYREEGEMPEGAMFYSLN